MSTEGRGELWKIPRGPGESPQRMGPAARRPAASPTVAGDGRLAYTVGSSTVPDEIFTLGLDGVETRLTDLNAPVARKFDFVEPERILCKGPDDWDIEGWVYKPLGYEPGKRYPTILSVHGGPAGMYGWGFHWQFQYLVGQGYAVVAMNPRGSEGYGGKFSSAIMGDFGGKEFHDLMVGVDYAVSTGLADPDRLGVTGGSHGGYMVTTPLLIMHGEQDYRCPIGQTEEMYTALRRQGKTAVLVRYPAEGHGFKQPHHVVDRWERTVAWFDHYLKRP